jgi:hypothetical protein
VALAVDQLGAQAVLAETAATADYMALAAGQAVDHRL